MEREGQREREEERKGGRECKGESEGGRQKGTERETQRVTLVLVVYICTLTTVLCPCAVYCGCQLGTCMMEGTMTAETLLLQQQEEDEDEDEDELEEDLEDGVKSGDISQPVEKARWPSKQRRDPVIQFSLSFFLFCFLLSLSVLFCFVLLVFFCPGSRWTCALMDRGHEDVPVRLRRELRPCTVPHSLPRGAGRCVCVSECVCGCEWVCVCV